MGPLRHAKRLWCLNKVCLQVTMYVTRFPFAWSKFHWMYSDNLIQNHGECKQLAFPFLPCPFIPLISTFSISLHIETHLTQETYVKKGTTNWFLRVICKLCCPHIYTCIIVNFYNIIINNNYCARDVHLFHLEHFIDLLLCWWLFTGL